jgi:hypothetical protein
VIDDLQSASASDAGEASRSAESLRGLLSTPPGRATNSVIVSHSSNLREAAGLWAKPEGVAYVFRPLPGGRFEPIARIAPKDWGSVARFEASSRPQ